jgi:polysaccharide biosynthesis protein PelC
MNFKCLVEMKSLTKSCRNLFVLLCACLSSACGTGRLPMQQQLTPLPSGQICRVAVLPFLNDSDFPLGDAIVGKVFATQFQNSGDYHVSQEGDILKIYQQLHLLPGMAPTLEQMQIIGNRVNAQLLITGIVLDMRENRGEHGTVNPLLVEEIQIRDGRSGETLWTTFHRRQGTDYKKTMHFGTLHTVTGLSRQMAEEIINLWFEKGLAQCNE